MPISDDARPLVRPNAGVAIVVRSDDPQRTAERLQPIVAALAEVSVAGHLVTFDEDLPEALRDEVRDADGVLVWADPLTDRGPRTTLDILLSEIAGTGVWVSAHPDVIHRMGTKDVLVTTRQLPWGTDAFAYPTLARFRNEFPARLAESATRVVKADRGNGGRTVWKVTLLDEVTGSGARAPDPTATVAVQHARVRDGSQSLTTLDEFMESCAPIYRGWGGSGHLIDQPYAPRIREGLIRCYVVHDSVVGFGLQHSADPKTFSTGSGAPRPAVFGVPSPKTMVPPDHPDFRVLRQRLDQEWIPAMCGVLGIAPDDLPVLWDVDLIRGAPSRSDPNPFVLCEINASSVIPFPPEAPKAVAVLVQERLLR